MSLALRLALRDLRGGLAGLRLLATCLFLGVLALAGVGLESSSDRADEYIRAINRAAGTPLPATSPTLIASRPSTTRQARKAMTSATRSGAVTGALRSRRRRPPAAARTATPPRP